MYHGWLFADTLEGPWAVVCTVPLGLNTEATQLAKAGFVDLLDGGPKANPRPTLAKGAPNVITSQVPSELIVFNGQPDFVPIDGTQLLWASNTTSDVFVNTVSSDYYGGYGCCASASANVYGHWGNTAYSGTRSWYAGGGVAGTTASGSYANARTGTSGSYAAGKQYNAKTGETNTWNGGKPGGNDTFADSNGNVTCSDGSGGWQQHSSIGWGAASGDTSWADRESLARSAGSSGFGGGGGLFGGGDRFGGGFRGGGGFRR